MTKGYSDNENLWTLVLIRYFFIPLTLFDVFLKAFGVSPQRVIEPSKEKEKTPL